MGDRVRHHLGALLMAAAVVALVTTASTRPGGADQAIGTTFPPDFPVIEDASLGVPVIGFGASGPVTRTPVIFLHGNNDTPYPTDCNGGYGKVQAFAQHFHDNGYAASELWALGYQGDQCDLLTDQTRRAGDAHTTVANVADVRMFVEAVLTYTGAQQVDIVGHSLGTTVAREWMRQDRAHTTVRRLVGLDGPNHGIINCSPDPQNYYQAIGFTPDSPVCMEYGAADTPFLTVLNAGDETPGPTEYLMVVNTDTSFVYIPEQDGVLPPVPAEDRTGQPHDFSRSAYLDGAEIAELTGQGVHDQVLLAAHTGIVNSPDAWALALEFLTRPAEAGPAPRPAPSEPAPPGRPAAPMPSGPTIPATGATPEIARLAVGALLSGAALRRLLKPASGRSGA